MNLLPLGVARDETRLFVALTLFFLIFRMDLVIPDFYYQDSYALIRPTATSDTAIQTVSNGRLGTQILCQCLEWLGLHPTSSSSVLSVVAFPLLAMAGVMIVRLWRLDPASPVAFVVGGLLFSHPYQAEIWTYRGAIFFVALMMVIGLAALLRLERSGGLMVAPLLVATALSIYQTVFSYLLVATFFAALLDLSRPGGDDPENISRAARRLAGQLAVTLTGALLYAVLTITALRILRIPLAGRGRVIHYEQAGLRVTQLREAMRRALWHDPFLSTPLLQGLLLAVLAFCCVLWLRRLRTAQTKRAAAAYLGAVLAALAGGAVTIVAAVLFLDEWWPAPRNLSAIGVAWAGIVAAGHTLGGQRSRALILGMAGVAILGMLGVNARVASDQRRVNRRDRSTANRIVARLESLPNFAELRRLVLVNHPYSWPDIGSTTFDVDVSALAIPWAQPDLVSELTGLRLERALPQDGLRAKEFCARTEAWPSPRSFTIADGVGIVCF